MGVMPVPEADADLPESLRYVHCPSVARGEGVAAENG
jgi:hypothetical protein